MHRLLRTHFFCFVAYSTTIAAQRGSKSTITSESKGKGEGKGKGKGKVKVVSVLN
jgi:hypothetical protein